MLEQTPFNDQLFRRENDDENLPEASTTDPSRILDSDEYEVYKNVPVFVEHTRTLKSGRELRFGRDELEMLAERSNRRIEETGDFAPVVIGHTNPDPAAPDPPKIGWAGPFRLGWLTKDHTKYAVLADFRIEKDKTKMLNKYPRRSAELWAEDRYEDMYLDPISLLGADTPWSDMGVLYCKQGDEQLEKIYYSIAPQVPGAYGTGLPKPVAVKPEQSHREKEKYAMSNDEYDRDSQSLTNDQKDVANTIINAIFDSPEFKFLRKMMNKEAEEIAKENDENAPNEQDQDVSTPETDDSQTISEKIAENPDSEGNNQGESYEYTGENNNEKIESPEVEVNGEPESTEEGSDENEEKDEPEDSEIKTDEDFEAYLDKNGLGGYKNYFRKQNRPETAESEPESDETPSSDEPQENETDEENAEEPADSESESNEENDEVASMNDDEFEEYLRKKYGVDDDDDETDEPEEKDVGDMDDDEFEEYLLKKYGTNGREEEGEDEEDADDEDEDNDDDDSESKDEDDENERANYAKEDDVANGNPYLSKTVSELETILQTKYGEEPPRPGDPAFNQLSTDLAFLAYLIKKNDETQASDDEYDDEDPFGVNENWNANHGDEAHADVRRDLDDARNRDVSIRQEFAKEPPEERRKLDPYYRWKYSRNTSPYALFDKGDDMTPKQYYNRRGRGDDQVEINTTYPTGDDGFDPQELLNANAAEEKTRGELASATDDQKPALQEQLEKIQQYQKKLRVQKKERDARFAEQYAKNAAGVAVNVLSPDYDGSLIWSLEATIGELEQLKEYLENKEWREAAKAKIGRALTREEEKTAWDDRLAELAKNGVWWATNPKLDYDPTVEDDYDEIDEIDVIDDSPISYEGEEEAAVPYSAEEKSEAEAAIDQFIAESRGDADVPEEEEEEPTEYAKKKKTVTPSSEPKESLKEDEEDEDEEEIAPDDSLVDPDSELENDGEDDGVEVEQNCREASEKSVKYQEGCEDGDCRSREDLLSEIDELKNKIAGLENAYNQTTEKVVSAERYSRLHALRERFLFDENAERENCRYSKMSDEQFEKHCEEIQANYRRVPTGIDVPFGLVESAPANAEDRPGAVQYAKEASADFERQVRERAESYVAQGIYKPSDEIRAEIAAENPRPER